MTPFDLIDEIVALIAAYCILFFLIRIIAGAVVASRMRRERNYRLSIWHSPHMGYAADFVKNPKMYCV